MPSLNIEGTLHFTETIEKKSGNLAKDPQITFQGVAGGESVGLVDEARAAVAKVFEAMSKVQLKDVNLLQENLRLQLKRFLQKKTGAKPVIVTTVVEV